MSFHLHPACWDTPCHCEEKQELLPHDSHLNSFNPQLHDTLGPGTFETCTSALETSGFHSIDHDNLRHVDPAGLPTPSASVVPSLPTSSCTPFVLNIETPSRFENANFHNPPLSTALPLCWDVPPTMLSEAANTTTNANHRKRKSSNVGASTIGKHKSSNVDASIAGPSKRRRQYSPNPTLVMDIAPKPQVRSRSRSPAPLSTTAACSAHLSQLEVPIASGNNRQHTPERMDSVSPTPSPALSTVSLPISVSDSPYLLPPSSNRPIHPTISSTTATDLWWFFAGVTSKERPPLLPLVELPGVKSLRPNVEQFPYVRCALWYISLSVVMHFLMSFNSQNAWKVYPNKSGVHSTIRRHLQEKHKNQYKHTVQNENLKDNIQKSAKNHDATCLPLTRDSLRQHLIEWITATDQVCHYHYLYCSQFEVFVPQPLQATEHPSFRKLLLHISDTLTNDDIPTRTTLTAATKEAADEILCKHCLEMQVSTFCFARVYLMTSEKCAEGNISSTNDVWTESNKMYSFIAITAHYILKDENGAYQLWHSLIGFEYLPGSHTGDHIAHVLFGIYTRLGITHQVSTKSLAYHSCFNAFYSLVQLLWIMLHQMALQ